jgi:histidine triad (HIT) family protein
VTCPFCDRIANGEFDPKTANQFAVTFEPLNPVTPGHLLVVSRSHIISAAHDPITAGFVMQKAAELAKQVSNANIITSIGEHATQTVPHLHLHIVPPSPGRRAEAALVGPMTDYVRYRTGRHNGFILYGQLRYAASDDDHYLGTFNEPKYAATACNALNGLRVPDRWVAVGRLIYLRADDPLVCLDDFIGVCASPAVAGFIVKAVNRA